MSPSVRAELRLQRASHGREPTGRRCAGCRNTPPPPQRRRRCVHVNVAQVHAPATAARRARPNSVYEVTYASPSLSKPLLRLTDGMSSMCLFPGSYVLCCGGARVWTGGGPPPRPRPPLLGNPLFPRGFDIVCCVSASVVYLTFHRLSLCRPLNFTRGTIPSKLSLPPSRRK